MLTQTPVVPFPDGYTFIDMVVDNIGVFVTKLKEWDLFYVFGVHINFFQFSISLFIVGTLISIITGVWGDINDEEGD